VRRAGRAALDAPSSCTASSSNINGLVIAPSNGVFTSDGAMVGGAGVVPVKAG
jgi:hypothetical protein